jgi:hypothetical protein
MWTLYLRAQILPEKREEFLNSFKFMPGSAPSQPQMHTIYQEVQDATSVCWLADWQTREELVSFLQSDAFRALRGAVKVLGSLVEVRVVETQQVPEMEN